MQQKERKKNGGLRNKRQNEKKKNPEIHQINGTTDIKYRIASYYTFVSRSTLR